MYGIEPTYSKEYILSHVRQEEAMEFYTGIPVTHLRFRSPLRADRSPTCTYKYGGNGMLYLKDFKPGEFDGNLFDLVIYKYYSHLPADQAFAKALERIGSDLIEGKERKPLTKEETKPLFDKQPTVFERDKQEWTKVDKDYWRSYGLDSVTLRFFMVHSVETIWQNAQIIYTYKETDPCYSYYFGGGAFKFYFPFRGKHPDGSKNPEDTRPRFFCNTAEPQGMLQLPERGDLLIITKSYKDVMVLYKMGFAAIAPQGEGHPIFHETMFELQSRFKQVVVLYDNDEAGIKGVGMLMSMFQLDYILMPEDTAKDISDYVKLLIGLGYSINQSIAEGKQLIEALIYG